jgi:hypothetical protein
MQMNDNQRLQLSNMIKANNVEDQTELIRTLKHSHIMRDEINTMIMLKAKYRDDPEKIHYECMNDCNFLFTYYTDIYNKVRKDEIDLGMLMKFIDVLKEIEDELIDQHEASFKVGTILKEMYIDSALKKAEKLDKLNEQATPEIKKEVNKISWKQYKSTFEKSGAKI